jgi:quercetin dioxygenase-like cupin family protein
VCHTASTKGELDGLGSNTNCIAKYYGGLKIEVKTSSEHHSITRASSGILVYMKLQKFRWSKVYESPEEELVTFLKARNIHAERSAFEPFQVAEQQSLDQDTTIWCAEGSLTAHINGDAISLQPGDALRIPAHTPYQMNAGMSGYSCYQSMAAISPLQS